MTEHRSIEDIDAEMNELHEQLARLDHERHEAVVAGLGVTVGDIVWDLRKGCAAKITVIRSHGFGAGGWLRVVYRRKDGSWGQGKGAWLYGRDHWRKATKVEKAGG